MPQAESEAQRIFHEVLAIEGAKERAEHLALACGGDALLRARAEALLGAYEQAGEFLSRPAHAAATTEQPGQMIGRYKLLEQLVEGGFGSVWMAEQREPVKRRVALKVIKLGMDTKQVIARFEAERQALALMDHPNIAKVLDAGATESGRPYFVMELVRGVPILEYCDKEKLDTARRLALFGSVCHAIQHAHQKGIIHRDIKPSNVLVTMHDGVPVPKVIDFGIAKATNSELTQKTLFTEHRQMIGTPAYMSPEQAEMSGLDIDTRADIYSLGVLLYELLTGTTPFDMQELLTQGFAEMMRAIREDEPHKPSTRISTLGDTAARTAQQRDVDVRKLGLLLRGDLDWIVMKCLEKDRTRRYETANGLAADIKRHLDGEPVIAAPASRAYRVQKFVKRNRAAVIAGCTIALVLVAGIVGTSWGMLWAVSEKDRADVAAKAESSANAQAQASASKAVSEAQRAEAEAQHARTAEEEAQQRANDLEQVAKFQAGMLSQVDPTTAGVRLTADVEAKFEAALVKAGVPDAERAEQLGAFDAQWRRVNATDAARELIDSTILKPAVNAIEKEFKDQPAVEAQLQQALANRYDELGLYEEALPLQEQALATRRRVLGEDSHDTSVSIGNLGMLQLARGDLGAAEPLLREARDLNHRILGEERRDTLISIGNLGSLLQAQGKYEEAETQFRDALEKFRRVLGNKNPYTLDAINNMGVLLQAQGRLSEAEPFLRECLELSREVLGSDSWRTQASVMNLGSQLESQGRRTEAEPYLREAVDVSRRVQGEGHPNTLQAVNLLGVLLLDEGRLQEAEPLLRDALARRRRSLGEDNRDTLVSIGNLGSLLLAQGKLSESESYCREALDGLRRTLGDDHLDTLIAINRVGTVLSTQNKLDEAEHFLREGLERSRRKLSEGHPDALKALANLGTLLHAQGKLEEAEHCLREVLEIRQSVLPRDHPSILISMGGLGALLVDLGRLSEAEGCLIPALEKCRRVLGDEDRWTLVAIGNLGDLLQAQGKHQETVDLLAPAEPAIRKTFIGGNARRVASLLMNLGKARTALGEFATAEANLLEARVVFVELRGPTHKYTRDCTQALVDLYSAWQTAEPGKGHDANAAEWKAKLDALPAPGTQLKQDAASDKPLPESKPVRAGGGKW